ncbi:MAG: hypothetical protein HKN86_00405 [Acidimicrobiia bacterium]|nr:hypothetical protein [Acidimicrobiia bacterium]
MLLNKFKNVFRKLFNYSNQSRDDNQSENSSTTERCQYLLISKERGLTLKKQYEKTIDGFSNRKLVKIYNENYKMRGIPQLGSLQGLYLMAMHKEFLNRFDKSPFQDVSRLNISLGKEIVYLEALETFIPIDLN